MSPHIRTQWIDWPKSLTQLLNQTMCKHSQLQAVSTSHLLGKLQYTMPPMHRLSGNVQTNIRMFSTHNLEDGSLSACPYSSTVNDLLVWALPTQTQPTSLRQPQEAEVQYDDDG
eukprot:GFUD01048994.1.p1 GENE.GFUD01048994.1~~GFUD01048994.1.p1  ORF type:complete len:114 (-),score=30.86 GFUD01048994.1:23-364(-)